MISSDNSSPDREAELFALAAEKPPAERASFLQAVSVADPKLHERLIKLLAAHEQADEFGIDRAPGVETLEVNPSDLPDEAVGQTLGRYKLLEKVGEGGCGVVYVAEQLEPVRRRVALKVIKLGMDTKAVVARFKAEQQALALMDHPNIAKVLDAGATEKGRLYFVMELVRGIRITEYCDQNNLPTKQRVELFIKVCQAIQHAHQKGIIHRDIKPSNILVTLHDGVPVPKVIDFGIAKATEGRLTEATVYTHLHQFIGTPAYMSPEQAEMSGLDIDTRSDIYSLGVLLYELLTGRTPFDARELMAAGIDTMRRTIREQEPARPSTRLATLQEVELTTTAKLRSVETSKLVHQVQGDIDWIVMKCLEKDRMRRYETANGVAADLKRHLNSEPVEARPPTAGYRLQKAIRRNKLAFTAAAGVVIALAVVSALLVRERAAFGAMKRAEQQAAEERVYFAILSGDEKRTRTTLEEAAEKGLPEAKLRYLRGLYFLSSAQAELAFPELAVAHELDPENVATLGLLATATAEAKGGPNFHLMVPKLQDARPETAEDHLFLGQALSIADHKQGIPLMEKAIREKDSPMARLILAAARTQSAHQMQDLALVDAALADVAAAKAWGHQSLPVILAACRAHEAAARLYERAGDPQRAAAEREEAKRASERLEAFHPNLQALRTRLAFLLMSGAPDEALVRAQRWSKEFPKGYFELYSIWALMVKGDFQKSLGIARTLPHVPLMRLVRFLAAIELPGTEAEIEEVMKQVLAQPVDNLRGLFSAVAVLELMGRTEQAKELARNLPHRGTLNTVVEFIAGEITETELLNSVAGATFVCSAEHFVGLRYLARGDRVNARKHLEAAVNSGGDGDTSHIISQYLLKRMEEKPEWPPTIAVRAE